MSHTPQSGRPDRQTLRLLERKLSTYPLVTATDYDLDAYEPRLLRAIFDSGQYPTEGKTARLDIRWFETNDFSIHYLESNGNRWECRWDRHPNPHNARMHFHEPPRSSTRDITLSDHPLEVLFTVLEAIRDRIERLWDDGT